MLKELISAALAVTVTATAAATLTPAEQENAADHVWSLATVVVEVDESANTVTTQDSSGFLWSFTGTEDWVIGDGCALTFYDNGTPEIFDDVILNTHFYRLDILSATAPIC